MLKLHAAQLKLNRLEGEPCADTRDGRCAVPVDLGHMAGEILCKVGTKEEPRYKSIPHVYLRTVL